MKRMIVVSILLLVAASIAQADSVVNVVFNPAEFGDAGSPPLETIALSFTWDTTTQTLSNFNFTSQGPLTGFASVPAAVIFDGPVLSFLSFTNGKGDAFQLDYGFHGFVEPKLTGTPGVYALDLNLECRSDPHVCTGDFTNVTDTATVTAVSTPEPGSLALLLEGLLGLVTVKKRYQFVRMDSV
jgi:hypothetical protein